MPIYRQACGDVAGLRRAAHHCLGRDEVDIRRQQDIGNEKYYPHVAAYFACLLMLPAMTALFRDAFSPIVVLLRPGATSLFYFTVMSEMIIRRAKRITTAFAFIIDTLRCFIASISSARAAIEMRARASLLTLATILLPHHFGDSLGVLLSPAPPPHYHT